MKEAKKGFCRKCGEHFYIHEHHVLPKSQFGGDGKTVKLCPNCHTHFHEYSKKRTQNPEDAEEAMKIWTTWLKKISVIVAGLALFYFLF